MSQSSALATATGKVGPALTFTSLALNPVKSLNLNFAASTGHITWVTPEGKPREMFFDLVLTTTLTDTISNLVNTLVISGT